MTTPSLTVGLLPRRYGPRFVNSCPNLTSLRWNSGSMFLV